MYDFEVNYRFFPAAEDGRSTGAPMHGYQCDWAYDGDDIKKTGIYMIWPEFEDGSGNVLEKNTQVPVDGIARMRIVSNELKDTVHKKDLK